MVHFTGILTKYVIPLLIATLFLVGLSRAGAALPDRPFIWYDDDDYPPFIYKGEDGQPQGLYKDLMVEIFKRMGIPLTYELYPWKRAQKYAEEGRSDGMVTTMTRKRRPLFAPTAPLYVKDEYAYARRDNPRIAQIMAIRSIEGLKPFKLVEVIGGGWAEEHFKGLDITWAPTYGTALNLLAKGRVDIFVLGRERMIDIRDRIKRNDPNSEDLKTIIISPQPLTGIEFHLLIRNNSEFRQIIPLFNKTLRQMKEDGSYKRILLRYFGDDGLILPPN